ncbi:MAG TPA: nucleotidyltransferase family protein [Candidatus Dormibacteraeota bacterium]|jgi:NDP-sugar pyrophosphorylase family protein|nr:nucleotidyltransferase family protein [Candidatus Dormibacteraeota bacterium]
MLPVAILAGGLATRLGPMTATMPKSLIPIDEEPFVVHQLRLLKSSGIQHVILCVGHMGEMIEQAIGDGRAYEMKVDYSSDGATLLGTAGATRGALPKLGKSFFVMYGDSYLPCDYAAVEREFLRSGKPGLMTVFRNNGQWDASNVEFAEGRILTYSKKNKTPRMRYIDYGLGVFQAEAFTRTSAPDLADVYADLLQSDELAAMEVHERFYEIGSPAGLQEMSILLSRRGEAQG